LCTYNHHRYHVDNSHPADIAAGKNQEIKLVYRVKEFQQKSIQRLTICMILKSQFGYQQDRTANPAHLAALFCPILKSDHLVTSLARATQHHIVINLSLLLKICY
jgi:hypothetical protein